MESLREKIAEIVTRAKFESLDTYSATDFILQIPEIKEALEYTERMSKHLAGMVAEDVAKLPIEPYSPKRISPS